jgi:hypothetical protein
MTFTQVPIGRARLWSAGQGPNADTYWQRAAKEVTRVRVRGKVWLVVETACGAETFRIFGASKSGRAGKRWLSKEWKVR